MASRFTVQEDELSCSVCHDVFKHPVGLSCGHSFCKDCLQDWWTERPSKECPVCQRRSSKDHPLISGNLCENLLEEKGRSSSSVSSEVLCTAHAEKLTLFCLNDEQQTCVVCRDSEKHAGHKFLPVDEAARRCKYYVQASLKLSRKKLRVFNEAKKDFDIIEDHIKVQARNTETQIKEQFQNLRRFLQEEEMARMAALREEEAQKSRELKEKIEVLRGEMEILSDAIQAAEDQLRADDQASFLENYKTRLEGPQLTLQYPPSVSGALIDQTKHLENLTVRVWHKMKDIVSYTPVILDPNTAHPGLTLSDDLTSARCVERAQQLPDNPERYDCSYRVLGSVGFNSGSHSWDVEVGDNKNWEVGVTCEESHVRKESKGGDWCDWFLECFLEDYTARSALGVRRTVLSVRQKPWRIRVRLDWNRGRLSFYDPDSNTHLHTFTHTFTGTLFPFVGVGDSRGPSLKMLPGKICVVLENHS